MLLQSATIFGISIFCSLAHHLYIAPMSASDRGLAEWFFLLPCLSPIVKNSTTDSIYLVWLISSFIVCLCCVYFLHSTLVLECDWTPCSVFKNIHEVYSLTVLQQVNERPTKVSSRHRRMQKWEYVTFLECVCAKPCCYSNNNTYSILGGGYWPVACCLLDLVVSWFAHILRVLANWPIFEKDSFQLLPQPGRTFITRRTCRGLFFITSFQQAILVRCI